MKKKKLKLHRNKILKKKTLKYKISFLQYGDFGIKSLETNYLELGQYNAIILYLKRNIKKWDGTVWLKIFPKVHKTKKSAGKVRMGKGKGKLDRKIIFIKKGQIIFEIKQKKYLNFYKILKECKKKLSIKSKLIKKIK